ncbi:hypothetical protein [Candidatus Chloroploca sp. Khr17]|uniref:hypothetical protein n=1 Tax=Candidatus Chloroploca sp. Khr17 TaxID=2496869 RepID=UPI00101E1678|nr:hypothetical protein [Candidatus Chloroploca sp. Khr17]
MPPTFYFALGARARPYDLAIALHVGQRHYLVPAGSSTERLLARTPGVHVVLDSGAFPPGNTARLSLPYYAHRVANWCTPPPISPSVPAPALAWALSYDTMGNPLASERDDVRLTALLQTMGHGPDPPIVPIIHYPGPGAAAIIGDLLRDREDCFDDEERAQVRQRAAWGFHDEPDGFVDRPACAIGGLVPARYARGATAWYAQLIIDLEAAAELDPFQRRIHLLGIGKPSWVCRSPLVLSFDSSGPARMAMIGFARGIGTAYTADYGISIAALRRSRSARLAYHLIRYRAQVGLPWNPIDEALLHADREVAALPERADESWEQPELPAAALYASHT